MKHNIEIQYKIHLSGNFSSFLAKYPISNNLESLSRPPASTSNGSFLLNVSNKNVFKIYFVSDYGCPYLFPSHCMQALHLVIVHPISMEKV